MKDTTGGTVLKEKVVVITEDDVEFIRQAKEDYQIFAKAAWSQGERRTAGIMRAQKLHAEQLLLRIGWEE